VDGHHADPHPPHRRQVRDRAGHSGGLLPAGRRPVRDLAANGGSPAHPNWYYNLKARPEITVEVGTQTFTVMAQELGGTARAELWPKLVAEWPKPVAASPDLGAAQARTARQFPVFVLTRQD
jgi:deazaflavin-dependent oxidoreductase (nitroreductase family)